jgi:hypothetical protein
MEWHILFQKTDNHLEKAGATQIIYNQADGIIAGSL